MRSPVVSVIMPVFNCEPYLAEAIDSVLAQTFTDFELLIIDDASTDSTIGIIKSYKDERIHLIQKPVKTGITESLNMGLQLARGEFIARMDGDDYSFPQRFEEQLKYLQTNPHVNMIGALYRVMGYSHAVKRPMHYEDIKVHLLEDNFICHPTIMIRKTALEKTRLTYDTDYETVEDYKFFTDMIDHGPVETFDQILLHYRVHSSQTSTVRAKYQVQMADRVRILMLNKLLNVAELTANQKELHLRFIKSRIDSSTSLKRQKAWVSYLVAENDKRNFFHQEFLTTFLLEKMANNTKIYFTTKHRLRISNLVFILTNFRALRNRITKKEVLIYTLKYFIPDDVRMGLRRLKPSI